MSMEDNWMNILLIVILLAVVALSLRRAVRHFRGGGCCGSAGMPRRRKRLRGAVACTVTMELTGLRCSGCRDRVEEVLNRLDGVSARVSLRRSRAVLRCSREPDVQQLRRLVEELGYQVVGTTQKAK